MPRTRNRTKDSSAATATSTDKNTTQGENKMANALSLDDIAGLLSGGRSKGDYDRIVSEFLASGEAGVIVAQAETDDQPTTSGELAGKSINQISTGLNNARTRTDKDTGKLVHEGGNKVKVLKRKTADGNGFVVALVNMALYNQE